MRSEPKKGQVLKIDIASWGDSSYVAMYFIYYCVFILKMMYNKCIVSFCFCGISMSA